jgi:hypothetical protein
MERVIPLVVSKHLEANTQQRHIPEEMNRNVPSLIMMIMAVVVPAVVGVAVALALAVAVAVAVVVVAED